MTARSALLLVLTFGGCAASTEKPAVYFRARRRPCRIVPFMDQHPLASRTREGAHMVGCSLCSLALLVLLVAGCATSTSTSSSGPPSSGSGWRSPDTGIVRFLDLTSGGPPWAKDDLGHRLIDFSEEIALVEDPSAAPLWITQDRLMRFGPYGIPVGKYPSDVGFPTVEACECDFPKPIPHVAV